MAAISPARYGPIFRSLLALFCALAIGLVALVSAAHARVPAPAAGVVRSLSVATSPPQGGGQGGGGASTTPTSSALASATLEQCLTAADPTARSATFNGQMSAVPGTRLMAMRIFVEEQSAGEDTFHTLSATGSGGWRRSEAGVKIYKYVRQFTDLPAPGAFRAVVEYRWLGEKGLVIKRAVRRTSICVQPDERPKLVAGRIQVLPVSGAAQLASYQVLVRNEGRSAAGPFAVALNVNGVTQPLQEVTALDPAAKTLLQIQAPRCSAGSTIEVVLDPQHQISEAAGGGESDTLPCPLAETNAAAARMR
jgi:CARDB